MSAISTAKTIAAAMLFIGAVVYLIFRKKEWR